MHAFQPLPKFLFEYIIYVLFHVLLKNESIILKFIFKPICKSFKCWHLPSSYDFTQTLIKFAFCKVEDFVR